MKRLGIYFSDTAYKEISLLKKTDEEYYHIELENLTTREVNSFKL